MLPSPLFLLLPSPARQVMHIRRKRHSPHSKSSTLILLTKHNYIWLRQPSYVSQHKPAIHPTQFCWFNSVGLLRWLCHPHRFSQPTYPCYLNQFSHPCLNNQNYQPSSPTAYSGAPSSLMPSQLLLFNERSKGSGSQHEMHDQSDQAGDTLTPFLRELPISLPSQLGSC